MLPLLILAATAFALDSPVLVAPADGATGQSLAPTLSVTAADGLTARFLGRAVAPTGDDFTVIVMPDTQFYACGCDGGSTDTFLAQTAWIAEQIDVLNIAYVAQLGDCVQDGDEYESEWLLADEAFSAFDEGRSPYPLPAGGLPYGVSVGNHDQTPNGDADGTTTYFNAYFGIDRFAATGWAGGYYGTSYDNHYDLFEAGGTAFVVVYLEYDDSPDAAVLAWADGVIGAYPDRHAIVVSHHLVDLDGSFSTQGLATYTALSHNQTLSLMLAGHIPGEASRDDDDGPRTVHSLLSDYQARENGGDGWLRIMTFQPSLGQIAVSTYSPTLDLEETDADSAFVLTWDPNPAPWTEIGEGPVTGGTASQVWSGLSAETTYEWKVDLSDGTETASGGPWRFTTGEVPRDTADTAADSTAADSTPADTVSTDTSETSAPPEDSAPASDSAPSDDSGPEATLKVAPAGCGCNASGALALPLLTLGLLRRRRRATVPADRGEG